MKYIVAIICLFFVLNVTVFAQTRPNVDVAIILATDVSGSITEDNFKLQVEGLAQAFESNEIHRAIQQGYHRQIAVMYMQWSSVNQQWISDWQIIRTPDDARQFANLIRQTDRKFSWDTSVIGLLTKSLDIMKSLPFEADKKVIDISGDGKDTRITAIQEIHSLRTILKSMEVQINALPIIASEPDVGTWYENHVIYGPGSFAIIVETFDDFSKAIRRKLLTEIGMTNENSILQ